MSDDRNQPVDWSDAGAFRSAFLAVFDAEDRAVLRQAGKILALSAIAGSDHHEVVVLGEFRAALEDARMLRDYLQQIAEEGSGELDSEAAELLAREAWHWHREASDLAHGMAASLQDATGEWPAEPGAERGTESEVEALEPAEEADRLDKLTRGVRSLLAEARKLRREAADGAVGQLVGHLQDDLDGLEAEPEVES